MIITDFVSNFISNFKNGYLSKKFYIIQPKSNQILFLVYLLLREGFIKGYKISLKNKNEIQIFLKYNNKNQKPFNNIIMVSKPSRDVFLKNKELYKKTNKFLILSTTVGFITTKQAKTLNLGGKVICLIDF